MDTLELAILSVGCRVKTRFSTGIVEYIDVPGEKIMLVMDNGIKDWFATDELELIIDRAPLPLPG